MYVCSYTTNFEYYKANILTNDFSHIIMIELERAFILENSREHLSIFFSRSYEFSAAHCCDNFNVAKMSCTEQFKRGKIAHNQKMEYPMAIPDDN